MGVLSASVGKLNIALHNTDDDIIKHVYIKYHKITNVTNDKRV